MNVTLPDLDEQERHEKGVIKTLSAILRMALTISGLEDVAKEHGLNADAVKTVELERDRLDRIVRLYGRG